MYLASSVFVRHTLNALYSDLAVALNKVSVHAPTRREKSLFIGLTAAGLARVGGAPGEWEVYVSFLMFLFRILIHPSTGTRLTPSPR